MLNIPELFILDKPVETPIGECRFIRVFEYDLLMMKFLPILSLNKNEIMNKIYEEVKKGSIKEKDFDSLIGKDVVELIKYNIFGLYDLFKELFNLIFDTTKLNETIKLQIDNLKNNKKLYLDKLNLLIKNKSISETEKNEYDKFINGIQEQIDKLNIFVNSSIFDRIKNTKELDEYCNLIKEMNCIKNEKPSNNPELDYYDKMAQILKEQKGEIITFKSMITSVGLYREDVLNLSIYNLHEYFNRIQCFETYHTGTLFSTIPCEKPYKITTYWFTDTNAKKTKLNEEDKKMIGNHMGMVQEEHENGEKQEI